MQTDKQTDLTKLIIAFCNFANAPNKTNRLEIFQFKSTISFDFLRLSFNSENMKSDGWKILGIHSLKFSSAFFLSSTDMSSSK